MKKLELKVSLKYGFIFESFILIFFIINLFPGFFALGLPEIDLCLNVSHELYYIIACSLLVFLLFYKKEPKLFSFKTAIITSSLFAILKYILDRLIIFQYCYNMYMHYWIQGCLVIIIICSLIVLCTSKKKNVIHISIKKASIITSMFIILIFLLHIFSRWVYILNLNDLIYCTVIALAHYEFNNKNVNYLSFKNAIIIGLIIEAIFLIGFYITGIAFSNYNRELSIFYITYILFDICFLFLIITVESMWKIFEKAGAKGWASIIPIYNIIVLLRIVKKPILWLVFLFIPIVNIIFSIWIINILSKRFGKNEGFTIGLIFLPFVFYPILGLSKLKYISE